MKKWMIILLIVILLGVGFVIWLYYVNMNTLDKNGMENPLIETDKEDNKEDNNEDSMEDEQIEILDGNNTYVDNEALLDRIAGEWLSENGHYRLQLDYEYKMLLQMDGESVLECEIDFTYLQPGDYKVTDISLEPASLTQADGAKIGAVTNFYHALVDDEDTLFMEIIHETSVDVSNENEMIVFKKSNDN